MHLHLALLSSGHIYICQLTIQNGWMALCVCEAFLMVHVCVNPFVLMWVYVCISCVSLSLCLLICACFQMYIGFCLHLCSTWVCVCVKQSISYGDSSWTPGQHRIVGKLDVTTIPIHHHGDINTDMHTSTHTQSCNFNLVRRTPISCHNALLIPRAQLYLLQLKDLTLS